MEDGGWLARSNRWKPNGVPLGLRRQRTGRAARDPGAPTGTTTAAVLLIPPGGVGGAHFPRPGTPLGVGRNDDGPAPPEGNRAGRASDAAGRRTTLRRALPSQEGVSAAVRHRNPR